MHRFTSNNPLFPSSLRQIASPPRELFIEGDWVSLINKPMLAVVGSRKASPYGRAVTENIVRVLAAYGVVVVSGLALGIDSIAHQTALDAGGLTIAILPSGLDNIYPPSHHQLAKNIIKQGGALITEYPPHTISYKNNFVARNRLIAGLAQAILVTEAAERSGSLHTVNFALEQGKDILVVPGPITSSTSVGCNNLIKAGATVITSPNDILNSLAITPSDSYIQEITANNATEYAILKMIKSGLSDGEELQKSSGLSASEFMQVMSQLEISGRIKTVGGNQWIII